MRRALLVALAAAALAGSGCAGPGTIPFGRGGAEQAQQPKDDPSKEWKGQTRHDLDPIRRRLRNLGEGYTATWAGGRYGINIDRWVPTPGAIPSWLDAVIRLRPEAAAELERQLGDAPGLEAPNIKKELRGELPSGSGSTSDALDAFVNQEPDPGAADNAERGWARVYLYPDQDVLVVNYLTGG